MFNFKSDFLKAYDKLNEASNPIYSRLFWSAAKAGIYDDTRFMLAFKDELKELGIDLNELFDEHYMFKEKGSYGIIKKALETHPDSWALKALQKVWVMQFKDGIVSDHKLKAEKYARERAERDAAIQKIVKEREEQHLKRHAEAESEWNLLNEKLPEVQKLIKDIGTKFANEHKDILIANLNKAIKIITDIQSLTKNTADYEYEYDLSQYKHALKRITDAAEDKLFEAEFEMSKFNDDSEDAYIEVGITRFMTAVGNTHAADLWRHSLRDGVFKIYAKNISENTVEEKLTTVLDKLFGAQTVSDYKIEKLEKAYKELEAEVEEVKKVLRTPWAGKETSNSNHAADFSDKLIKICVDGLNAADKAAKEWSNVHDGSDGAAYAGYYNGTIEHLARYLVHCDWRALKDEKEIASWNMTESQEKLRKELDKVLSAVNRFSQYGIRFEVTEHKNKAGL